MLQLGLCVPGSACHPAMAASCRLVAEVRPADSILSSGGKRVTCVQPRVLDMQCCHHYYYNVTNEFGAVRTNMTLPARRQCSGRGWPLKLEG